MADSFQSEIPKARVNIRLDLHTGGAQKKVELPLKLQLQFQDMKDFEPEQVARQIPQLRAMLAMRNLLRDLKSNLLDNVTFRKELEKILKDPSLSDELRNELNALAPSQNS